MTWRDAVKRSKDRWLSVEVRPCVESERRAWLEFIYRDKVVLRTNDDLAAVVGVVLALCTPSDRKRIVERHYNPSEFLIDLLKESNAFVAVALFIDVEGGRAEKDREIFAELCIQCDEGREEVRRCSVGVGVNVALRFDAPIVVSRSLVEYYENIISKEAEAILEDLSDDETKH